MKKNFDKDFRNIYDHYEKIFTKKGFNRPSQALRDFLKNIYDAFYMTPQDVKLLKLALQRLFEYIISPEGRTNLNCQMVFWFISDYDDKWKPDLSYLPETYRVILTEIEFMHGAIDEPKYHTSPEVILQMIMNLPEY